MTKDKLLLTCDREDCIYDSMETITQKEMAYKLGVSQSFLSRILSGDRRPMYRQAKKLQAKSGVDKLIWLEGSRMEIIEAIREEMGLDVNLKSGRPKKK